MRSDVFSITLLPSGRIVGSDHAKLLLGGVLVADEKIDLGNDQGSVNVTQNIGDLKQGILQNDPSRISAYKGDDQGVHTGTDSATVGRHGDPFGKQ
jgi:hypothetical protein